MTWLFRLVRFLQGRDYCELCDGKRGVRGNENILWGVVMCDDCHAEFME